MISLAPLHDVMARTGLDALVLVPGANFRRVFAKDFHQMERPLEVIVPREGQPVAIVPNLEMASFAPIGFPGQVFDWRDEKGYMGAFEAAGAALPQLQKDCRIGVEGQRMLLAHGVLHGHGHGCPCAAAIGDVVKVLGILHR